MSVCPTLSVSLMSLRVPQNRSSSSRTMAPCGVRAPGGPKIARKASRTERIRASCRTRSRVFSSPAVSSLSATELALAHPRDGRTAGGLVARRRRQGRHELLGPGSLTFLVRHPLAPGSALDRLLIVLEERHLLHAVGRPKHREGAEVNVACVVHERYDRRERGSVQRGPALVVPHHAPGSGFDHETTCQSSARRSVCEATQGTSSPPTGYM